MAVTFTPNIGLAKPDKTELAKNWAGATGTLLDAANNTILADKLDTETLTYTPVLKAATTDPNVGAGSSVGEYQVFQNWVIGFFVILFTDPGIIDGVGSGAYGISLPFPADNTFHSVGTGYNDNPGQLSVIGEGYFEDASAILTSGILALDMITISGVSYARLITQTFTGKGGKFVGPGGPVAKATGDRISANFFYKKA